MNNSSGSTPSPLPQTRFGLRFKILLALTIFNAVAITLFTFDRYASEKQRIMEGIEQKLDACTRALPDMLPDGYLDRTVRSDAVTDAEYRGLVNKLTAFCNSTGLRYLYTYARQGDGFYCTSTNGTPEEMKTDSYTRYWAKYDTAPQSIFQAWDSNKAVNSVVSDQWGRTYTLFLPMQTKAGAKYIAGADLPIDFIDDVLNASLERTLFIGIASFILFFVISFWASTRFSRHITLLASYTHELAANSFAPQPDSPLTIKIKEIPSTRADEVGQLANSFLQMEERLQSYIKELTETTAVKERIQNELRIAGEIQASMLPQDIEHTIGGKHIDVSASMSPAKEAGGDLYDVFLLDDDHLLFVIADVSDKGMPAALFMAATVTILRARATAQFVDSPEVLMTRINEQLIKQNSMYQFVTTFLGVIKLSTGEVATSDGGHNRPYLRRLGKPAAMLPRGGGIALGVMPEAVFKRATLQLQPGDTLLLYTDGVTEALAADESFYGEHRLETLLSNVPGDATAAQWVSTVTEDVGTFSKGHVQADDITVVALRYLG
ncbi:MAG: SpoIIE family protein phosphatase [Opitutaceae bacterium]|jgi:sigma-B regulation protein RsbU (phosphoserine phosphatase)